MQQQQQQQQVHQSHKPAAASPLVMPDRGSSGELSNQQQLALQLAVVWQYVAVSSQQSAVSTSSPSPM
jgi:hypothetical protein